MKEKGRILVRYKIGAYIELTIISLLIILNIFDLLEYLTPTFDYVDKISGIIGLSYLIYLASPTAMIIGKKIKRIDLALIGSFVLLIFNKITTPAFGTYEALQEKAAALIEISKSTAAVSPEFTLHVSNVQHLTSADLTSSFYQTIIDALRFSHPKVYFAASDGAATQLFSASTVHFSLRNLSNYIDGSLFYFMKFLAENQVVLEKIAFYAGGMLLLGIAAHTAWKERIYPSSFLHVLHGDKKWFHKKPLRAAALFLCFCFFFLFIFQLMVEWLGVVIDAPIVFLGILFYIVVMVKYRHLFGAEHLITKIGETGEKFYEDFIHLFHTPYGVALGFSGILILHLLTDFGVYIISYTVYQHELLYFEQGPVFFATHHIPLFSVLDIFSSQKISLFFQDIGLAKTSLDVLGIVWVYLFNIIAIFFLFLAPAYIWFILFRRKKAHEREWLLVVCSIALMTYSAFPLFHIGIIEVPGIVGADITTSSITETSALTALTAFRTPFTSIIVSILVGLVVYVLSFKEWLRRDLIYLSFCAAVFFFAVYLFSYFISICLYYWQALAAQFLAQDYFVLFYMAVFALLSLLFYPVSFIVFVYELIKHYRLAKKE